MKPSHFFLLASRAARRAELAAARGDAGGWQRWTAAADFWFFCGERWW